LFRTKILLLLLILALVGACGEPKAPSSATPVADNEANRTAAAKHYLEVAPPQELLTDMTDKVVKILPENQRKMFLSVMQAKSLQDATYRISLNALVKHFTVNELKAMTAFYSTPEGKSIRPKLSLYMADIMPQISKEVVEALTKAEKEEQAKSPQGQKSPGQLKPAEPKGAQPQVKPAPPQPQAPAPPKAQKPPAQPGAPSPK
jgi:hypothetical protein